MFCFEVIFLVGMYSQNKLDLRDEYHFFSLHSLNHKHNVLLFIGALQPLKFLLDSYYAFCSLGRFLINTLRWLLKLLLKSLFKGEKVSTNMKLRHYLCGDALYPQFRCLKLNNKFKPLLQTACQLGLIPGLAPTD